MVVLSPLAGKPLEPSRLVEVARLIIAYFTDKPDPTIASQRVSFGTSGHRGSSFKQSFNEAHIPARLILDSRVVAISLKIARELGTPFYERIDAPATPAEKARLLALSPDQIDMPELADGAVRLKLSMALGNGAPIGELKVVADNGWFAVRPSGTEGIYKFYAESFRSEAHLQQIQQQAEAAVAHIVKGADAQQHE